MAVWKKILSQLPLKLNVTMCVTEICPAGPKWKWYIQFLGRALISESIPIPSSSVFAGIQTQGLKL